MDIDISLDYGLTLLAALLIGTGFVLQQNAAEREPDSRFLSLRLMTDLLRAPRWLAGIGAMIGGQVLAAWSIGHLTLSVVEPLLTTNLIWALILAVPLSRRARAKQAHAEANGGPPQPGRRGSPGGQRDQPQPGRWGGPGGQRDQPQPGRWGGPGARQEDRPQPGRREAQGPAVCAGSPGKGGDRGVSPPVGGRRGRQPPGRQVRAWEVAGAAVLCVGVGLLSSERSTKPIGLSFGSFSHWPAAAAIAAIAFICVQAGRRREGRMRALLTGIAAGLVYGIQDALTRQTLEALQSGGISGMLSTWAPYALVGAGAVGIWLMQSAFSAGPIQMSLPAISAGEPLVGILLGIIVFGDRIQVAPLQLGIKAGGIAALVAGVILVARAPALSHLRTWPPAGTISLSSIPHPTLPSFPHRSTGPIADIPGADDDAREKDSAVNGVPHAPADAGEKPPSDIHLSGGTA